jgi:hypothetical protein
VSLSWATRHSEDAMPLKVLLTQSKQYPCALTEPTSASISFKTLVLTNVRLQVVAYWLRAEQLWLDFSLSHRRSELACGIPSRTHLEDALAPSFVDFERTSEFHHWLLSMSRFWSDPVTWSSPQGGLLSLHRAGGNLDRFAVDL